MVVGIYFAFASDATFMCCGIPILVVVIGVIIAIAEHFKEKEQKEQAEREGTERREQKRLLEDERSRKQAIADEAAYHLFEGKRNEIQQSTDYKLIEQFARKFSSNSVPKEILNLNELLGGRGWKLGISEVQELVRLEDINQRRIRSKERLLNLPANSTDDLIRNFLSLYQPNDYEGLTLLGEVLRDRNELNQFGDDLGGVRLYLVGRQKEIELETFERRLVADDEPIVSIEFVDGLSGYEFEAFLVELFIRMGYSVEQTKLSGDQGADILANKLGERVVVQAKCFQGKVGNFAVQEIVAAITMYAAHRGSVVTNSYFTQAAKELAVANNVELVDRDGLEELIRNYW